MKTVKVELIEGEVNLIAFLIEERARIFPNGVPDSFGETHIGEKMLQAKIDLGCQREGK